MGNHEGLCAFFNQAGGGCNFSGPEKPLMAKERTRKGGTYWLCKASNGGAVGPDTLREQNRCNQNPNPQNLA